PIRRPRQRSSFHSPSPARNSTRELIFGRHSWPRLESNERLPQTHCDQFAQSSAGSDLPVPGLFAGVDLVISDSPPAQ
ncbi:hypothetical protein C8R44DRAFT_976499, partial [Mycena epipterygia]